jgi:hypothetical protein
MLVHLHLVDDVGSHLQTVLQLVEGREEYFLDNLEIAEIAYWQVVHDEHYLLWKALEQYGGTNYPLEWTGNRQSVICDKCKRIYSLENGTITSGGKSKSDKPLMQYRVTYGGKGTDIYVGN